MLHRTDVQSQCLCVEEGILKLIILMIRSGSSGDGGEKKLFKLLTGYVFESVVVIGSMEKNSEQLSLMLFAIKCPIYSSPLV